MASVDWETVEETRQMMAEMPPGQVEELDGQMREEQGVLRAYLLGAAESFPPAERERLIYLGLLVWQCMTRGERILGKVTKTRIQRAMGKNAALMNTLAADTDADFYSGIQAMMETYPEPNVLRVVAEEINGVPGFSEKNSGEAFLVLKITLDALTYSLWK